jgi:DNA-binding NarL/FixJ family response regulator
MLTMTQALKMIDERGPRYAVYGQIRSREAITKYAPSADLAEKYREQFEQDGYRQVKVLPPEGSVDLEKLGRERADARRIFNEKTQILQAAVLRALEDGRAEAEVARAAGVDRMTVRSWAGK